MKVKKYAHSTIIRVRVRYDNVLKCLKIAVMTVALGFATKAHAQYDVLFSHYFDMETSFNPAAAGKQSKLNITAAYAMDLAGFEHNPQTAYVSADMPFVMIGGVHGAGAQFMNDKIGLFNHMRISAMYANKQRIGKGTLSIGVQAGLLSEKFDGSKLDVEDTGDPALASSEVSGNTFDLGLGIYYSQRRFYAGISAQHLTAPVVELGERNELKIERSYYATVGYAIPFRSPNLQLMTSAIGRTDMKAWRADVTARLLYTNDTKRMYGGLSYSPTNSVTVLFGMNIKGINFGYSYECYTNGLNPGNGSHELCVGYEMDINLGKKGRNLHKSVRLL